MKALKIIILIFSILFSIISIFLIALCVSMSGENMGNEAYGYNSFFILSASVFAIPAILLWLIFYFKFIKKNKE